MTQEDSEAAVDYVSSYICIAGARWFNRYSDLLEHFFDGELSREK